MKICANPWMATVDDEAEDTMTEATGKTPVKDADRVVSRYEIEVTCYACRRRTMKSVRVYGDNRRVSTCPLCAEERGWGGNG